MSQLNGQLQLDGKLSLRKLTPADRERLKRREIRWWKVKNFFTQRWREVPTELYLLFCRLACRLIPGANMPMHGRLYLKVIRQDGEVWDYGCAGCHLITTAGKNYMAGSYNNTNEPENFKFHGFGTGTTAPAVGNTALETEETTQYNPDNTRPTGSQSVTTNVYTTVATYSPDSGGTRAITEWGLLTQAATGGGTLLDRQTFSAVNIVASADSLQATYTHTVG